MRKAIPYGILYAFSVSIILVVFLADNQPAWASAFPGTNGKIVFSEGSNNPAIANIDIYIMNSDGTARVNLTPNTENALDRDPALSPQGNMIAFVSDRNGISNDIYVMNIDGSGLINISNSSDRDEMSPSWSPDGTKIVFTSNSDTTSSAIYVMNIDGTGLRYLVDGRSPTWSPDATKIAFIANRAEPDSTDVHIMNVGGEGQILNITQDTAYEIGISWSPDSDKIAFASNREFLGNLEGGRLTSNIFIVNSNGSGTVTRITNYEPACTSGWDPVFNGFRTDCIPVVAHSPMWSPDGSKIAHSISDSRDASRWVIITNVDGSEDITIQTSTLHGMDWGPLDEAAPVISSISDSPDPFSPNADGIKDSSTISFISSENGEYHIVIRDIGQKSSSSTIAIISGVMVAGNNEAVWDSNIPLFWFKDDPDPQPFPDNDGTYTYFISVSDAAGNALLAPSGGHGTITIDRIPPTITVLANVTLEATGPSGAPLIFGANANDLVDGAIVPECDHASGDIFPIDTTTVTCTATDSAGNTSPKSFTVHVQDTTTPVLILPADIIDVSPTSPQGAITTFTVTATDIVDSNPEIDCTPASGSVFPHSTTTTVFCTAIDDSGNSDSGSFTVTVLSPAEAADNVVDTINDMNLPKGAENSLLAPLKKISNNLNDGNSNNDAASCGQLDAFINEVDAKERNGDLTTEQANYLRTEAINIKAALGC